MVTGGVEAAFTVGYRAGHGVAGQMVPEGALPSTPSQGLGAADRRVGIDRRHVLAEQQRRLAAERTAAVQSSHIALGGSGARHVNRQGSKPGIVRLPAGRKRDRDDCRILELLRHEN